MLSPRIESKRKRCLVLAFSLALWSSSAGAGLVSQWRLVYETVVPADSTTALTSDVVEFDQEAGIIASGFAVPADGLGISGYVDLGADAQAFVTDRYVELSGGIAVGRRTVVRADSSGFSVALDAESAGLPSGAGIDALFRTSEGLWVISTDIHVELGGQTYSDGDLIGHDGQDFFLISSESELGLPASADICGIAQGTGGRWLISMKSGGITLDGLPYLPGDVLRANPEGRLTAIELRSREAPLAISAGLNALSAEPAPDELFGDRFQE
jgi:hypothetical protein